VSATDRAGCGAKLNDVLRDHEAFTPIAPPLAWAAGMSELSRTSLKLELVVGDSGISRIAGGSPITRSAGRPGGPEFKCSASSQNDLMRAY
jgi:hypothetical protein